MEADVRVKPQVREADMRSLERRSMYAIFAPLDANEALPRELILEGRRHRAVGRRELAGALWIPALFLILWSASLGRLNGFIVIGAIVVALAGFAIFAFRESSS
jgi:hypothetical protein